MEIELGYSMVSPTAEKGKGVVLGWKDVNYSVDKKLEDGSIQSRTLLSKMSG
jgi:hypothetical protein